jgi:Resolvase, N terminal domain
MAEELQPEARRQILSLLLAGRLYIDELRSERGVGLGLEAQQAAVRGYLGQSVPIAEFTEIETDNRNDRPELERALALCRKRKARLVIAKLDRLSGVEFVAVDNPHATRLTLHILAAVAEHEREMIAARTKAALPFRRLRARLPIVFSVPEDPIKLGLVASIARPGGNATGVSFLLSELGPKQLGLLHELLPAASRAGSRDSRPHALSSTNRTTTRTAAHDRTTTRTENARCRSLA